MRAKIEFVEMNETATTVSVTDTRNRTAVVKVFSDGSRAVLSGGAWIVENLFRSGQRASDKSAFREAVQAARETGSAVLFSPLNRLPNGDAPLPLCIGVGAMFNFLLDVGTYDSRKVMRDDFDWGFISTARVSDGRHPYETAVEHPEYNNGLMVIVEAYDTTDDAKKGHLRWVETMTADSPPVRLVDCGNSEWSEDGRIYPREGVSDANL